MSKRNKKVKKSVKGKEVRRTKLPPIKETTPKDMDYINMWS